MPPKKQYNSAMRNVFGLQPEPEPDSAQSEHELTEQEKNTSEPETEFAPVNRPEPVIRKVAQTKSLAIPAKVGRPTATAERVPKTLSIDIKSEDTIDTAIRQIQNWRGRGRGIPKVQQGEVVDFALEYLRIRLFEGVERAEAFFLTQKEKEGNYSNQ